MGSIGSKLSKSVLGALHLLRARRAGEADAAGPADSAHARTGAEDNGAGDLVTALSAVPRVLVVDDEPDFLETMEDLLSDSDLEVLTAPDPEVALTKLAAAPVDVMLVDLQMPKGGGKRLLSEAQRFHPEVCSIVVTAYGSESIAVQMLKELGAVDYFPKTDLDEERLLAAIRGAMRQRYAASVSARRGFEIVAEEQNGILALYPTGFLTAQPKLVRLHRLADAIDAASKRGVRQIVIDLSHLESVVAVALGFAVAAVARFERAGGAVAVVGADRRVARVLVQFDRSRLGDRGLAIYNDRSSALQALQARADS